MTDCFHDEGVTAWHEGGDLSDNPYEEGTDGGAGWRAGWLYAEGQGDEATEGES